MGQQCARLAPKVACACLTHPVRLPGPPILRAQLKSAPQHLQLEPGRLIARAASIFYVIVLLDAPLSRRQRQARRTFRSAGPASHPANTSYSQLTTARRVPQGLFVTEGRRSRQQSMNRRGCEMEVSICLLHAPQVIRFKLQASRHSSARPAAKARSALSCRV